MRAAVKSELERLNVSRTAPKDAYAELKNGSVHVINAKKVINTMLIKLCKNMISNLAIIK
ncbi:hypothetical protein V8V50_02380 [Ligilactobacillus salivarius]